MSKPIDKIKTVSCKYAHMVKETFKGSEEKPN